MIVQVDKVVCDVRTAIDMNRRDSGLFNDGDTDTLELDTIIISKIADAVRMIETEAPTHLLETGQMFDASSIAWEDGGKGWLLLPDDFMRLVVFRMSDWERPVYGAITQDDPLYLRQMSRYKGIYGSVSKPVVAIVVRSEGKVLEFFSCNSEDATAVQSVYRRMPKIDRDGGIELSEHCYDAIVYRAASMALSTVGDQLAETMLDLSKTLLI